MRRTVAALGLATAMLIAVPGVALAQEPTPPAEVTCLPLLSSLVCYIPVNVGPFGPFIFFPNGLGSPPPATP
jgi:hypothetical protein